MSTSTPGRGITWLAHRSGTTRTSCWPTGPRCCVRWRMPGATRVTSSLGWPGAERHGDAVRCRHREEAPDLGRVHGLGHGLREQGVVRRVVHHLQPVTHP